MDRSHLLGHYGNHHVHCRKHIDIEHVVTMWILDYAVNVLGRDHVDPFLVRDRLFEALVPLLGKYPKVKEKIEKVLADPDYRSDQCLDDLRDLEEAEVFGPWGDLSGGY